MMIIHKLHLAPSYEPLPSTNSTNTEKQITQKAFYTLQSVFFDVLDKVSLLLYISLTVVHPRNNQPIPSGR